MGRGSTIRIMMVRIVLLCTLWFGSVAVLANENRDLLQKKGATVDVKASLISKESWIQYPAYTDRAGWDLLTGSAKKDIIELGEKYLSHEWKVIKATDYLEFERSGDRVIMQNTFNANFTALSTLIFAELSEGKGRFLDQIINGIWNACDMPSWALSAHLVTQQSRRSLPDFNEQIIDHASGDIGAMCSWTYYFLHAEFDKVNPVISRRIRKEVQDRILTPYTTRDDFFWQALKANPNTVVNNWNPWCNSNVLTCFLLIEDNKDALTAAVLRTMRSVDKFLNYIHEDGACEEGPLYWDRAAGKLFDYLQLLSNATNGKVSIFENPMIKNMGEYIGRSFIGNGWVVNFADAFAKGICDADLVFRYGQAVNSIEMKQFAAFLVKSGQENKEVIYPWDFFRKIENLRSRKQLLQTTPSLPRATFTWYPQTQFCFIRNTDGFFLGAKGGHNDESHNHNDVGTFSLYYHDIPFLIDAGVGTYTRQTFSPERYNIWTMQSNYHNLPLINGQPQHAGRDYRATDVKFDSVNSIFSVDIAGAYDTAANVRSWIRSYSMTTGKGLTIKDAFSLLKASVSNQLNFLTWVKPDLSKPGEALLSKDGKTLKLSFDNSRFTAHIETIPLTDPRLFKVWGDSLYRLTLTAKKLVDKGAYTITITPI